MGIFKKNKKERKDPLSREDAEKFFRLGERLAEKIKLKERIERINAYGTQKPQMAFLWIFVIVAGLFVLGALWPKPNFSSIKEDTKRVATTPKPNTAEEEFKKEMTSIFNEMEILTDTISKLMEKDSLTQADSIFLVEKYARLESLNEVINKEFEREE